MKQVKFGVSGHFLENTWRKLREILHIDVSWPPLKLISSGSRSIDYCNFGTILTWWNGSNWGFPDISWKTQGGNGLKFCMLMYLDHIQNWLVLGYGNFCNFGTILTLWNWSNLGFLGISWRTHRGNGLTYSMLLYPDHLQNWLDYGYGLVIFLILALFWLSEMGQIWGYQAFSGKLIEETAWHFACWCILTTFRTD